MRKQLATETSAFSLRKILKSGASASAQLRSLSDELGGLARLRHTTSESSAQLAAGGGGLASWALAGPASAQLAGRACSHHASAGTHASASGQLAAPDF